MPDRKSPVIKHPGAKGAVPSAIDKDKRQAAQERKANGLSKPGGFKNDPDDPTNPNEVRERHLRKLRP